MKYSPSLFPFKGNIIGNHINSNQKSEISLDYIYVNIIIDIIIIALQKILEKHAI